MLTLIILGLIFLGVGIVLFFSKSNTEFAAKLFKLNSAEYDLSLVCKSGGISCFICAVSLFFTAVMGKIATNHEFTYDALFYFCFIVASAIIISLVRFFYVISKKAKYTDNSIEKTDN